jgi:hypothetical protein
VFGVGADPVQFGLVASLNRPRGNLTGFNVIASELGAKALALLHELVPGIATIGFLENPTLTAPTFMALPCRWRSRPQHHNRTSCSAVQCIVRDAQAERLRALEIAR